LATVELVVISNVQIEIFERNMILSERTSPTKINKNLAIANRSLGASAAHTLCRGHL